MTLGPGNQPGRFELGIPPGNHGLGGIEVPGEEGEAPPARFGAAVGQVPYSCKKELGARGDLLGRNHLSGYPLGLNVTINSTKCVRRVAGRGRIGYLHFICYLLPVTCPSTLKPVKANGVVDYLTPVLGRRPIWPIFQVCRLATNLGK